MLSVDPRLSFRSTEDGRLGCAELDSLADADFASVGSGIGGWTDGCALLGFETSSVRLRAVSSGPVRREWRARAALRNWRSVTRDVGDSSDANVTGAIEEGA